MWWLYIIVLSGAHERRMHEACNYRTVKILIHYVFRRGVDKLFPRCLETPRAEKGVGPGTYARFSSKVARMRKLKRRGTASQSCAYSYHAMYKYLPVYSVGKIRQPKNVTRAIHIAIQVQYYPRIVWHVVYLPYTYRLLYVHVGADNWYVPIIGDLR